MAKLHAYPPHHNAGAEWAAHNLLRALAARGHQVEVHLSEAPGPREAFDLDGVQVIPPALRRDFGKETRTAGVVISHLENVPSAAAAARGWGRPLVVLCHNTFPATFKQIGSGTTALAVYNSQWMAAAAGEYFAEHPKLARPEREVIVRPPVVAADYAASPGNCITLINLFVNKGSDVFWQLAERMPGRKFLAVRGSYGEQDVRDLPNVEVVDNVPGPEMAKLVYGRTRILLMPSEYESWGRVGAEAMASGIPVIATPTPGLRESLGKAGTFVRKDDLDGWQAAVERLDDPAAYETASAAALQRSAQLDPAADLARWCKAIEALG
ncbi:glycosyltransferase family 4 protein [Streptosporangium sp. NPDC050855]|uniref:glycosyltransferase family 4 protein n=1 Tax=Streptosporangium sp. NPDC050855 TaxID=3366194 RepID=UPI00378E9A9E